MYNCIGTTPYENKADLGNVLWCIVPVWTCMPHYTKHHVSNWSDSSAWLAVTKVIRRPHRARLELTPRQQNVHWATHTMQSKLEMVAPEDSLNIPFRYFVLGLHHA